MKTVFAREIGELSFLIGALVGIAGFTGFESVSPGSDYDGMLAFVIVSGAAVGLIQGGLDRWRRGDLFFKHRPVGALSFEVARTVAGLIAALAPCATLLMVHRLATAQAIEQGRSWGSWGPVRQLTGGEAVLLGAALLCTWASIRYGLSRPRVWVALVLCGALPVACWAMGSRMSTHIAAASLAFVAAALFVALSVTDLAGDRR